jgi:hypothetical protein
MKSFNPAYLLAPDKPWEPGLPALLPYACRPSAQGRLGTMLSLEFPFQVRPELLQDIGSHVGTELDAELRRGVSSIPAVDVVGVRNRHCGCVSQYFRIIKLRPARIAMGLEDLTHGVAEP